MKGRINSFQSLGALDGPGIRFVVFFQGCNLRCGCCHNPETFDILGGKEYTAKEIVERVERYKEYFKKEGGITLSGGEPTLQPEFAKEIFTLCKQKGINTCLDTSGSILNDSVKELFKVTDRVLLDIKYTNDADYEKYVGCSLKAPLETLKYLNQNNIPVTLRQVIVPTINDNEKNILELKKLLKEYPVIDGVELLPFKKICQVKYDKLKKDFPFKDIPEATPGKIKELEKLLLE